MMHMYVYTHISCIFRSVVMIFFTLCLTTKTKKLAPCDKAHAHE